MTSYFAFLGNTPELSLLELGSLIGTVPNLIGADIAKFETDLDPIKLGDRLGGTIKIATKVQDTTLSSVESDLAELISFDSQKNVAITVIGPAQLNVHAIKTKVVETRPVRFLSLETSGHSLVALRKQHISEFVVFNDGIDLIIAKTIWIHDADDWTRRDRSKPYHAIKRGMLPPKVARIMVNLATRGKGMVLADPFCGTGTVLAEALLSGCSVIGSDTEPSAIEGSKQNLDWLISIYAPLAVSYELSISEASHLHQKVSLIDAIASEPYMGPLIEEGRFDLTKIKNIAKGLEKLYIGALRSWHGILTGKGRVVFIIPSFYANNRVISTLAVDDFARLGYNLISTVPYGKPGATVVRNITILEKK